MGKKDFALAGQPGARIKFQIKKTELKKTTESAKLQIHVEHIIGKI